MFPECYGADIREVYVSTQEECKSGCANYAGERGPCLFVTWGNGRCIYKNGETSVYGCRGCDSNGYCAQKSSSCNPASQYCSTNLLMRSNRQLRSNRPPTTTEPDAIASFSLTSYTSETTDHGALCTREFGSDAVVADWDKDLKQLSVTEIQRLVHSLGITPTFNEKYYFVTKGAEKVYRSGRRVYFFERHDGPAPSNWLVHDQHAGLSLGSWYDVRGQVVCKLNGAIGNGDATPYFTTFILPTAATGIILAVCVCFWARKCRRSTGSKSINTSNSIHRTLTPVAATIVVPTENSIAKVPIATETGTRPAPVSAQMSMPPVSTTEMQSLPVAAVQVV